jgi:heme/copper-type cytochrome/quinol oxidase subunit 3
MYTFLLASLVFSYFYLRSSNNGQLWRPDNQHAPIVFGWFIYVLMVATALLAIFANRRLKSGDNYLFQVAGWTGVGTGVLALVLQCVQLTRLSFYPGASGYASSFIGFAVLNITSIVVGTYWLETTLARELTLRREYGMRELERAEVDTGEEFTISGSSFPLSATAQEFRAGVASMAYFWGFLAIAGALLTYMFYIV